MFDYGDEEERTLPANLLCPESIDPASADTPFLSVSAETDLMELIVSPINIARAWRQVRLDRGCLRSRRTDDHRVRGLV